MREVADAIGQHFGQAGAAINVNFKPVTARRSATSRPVAAGISGIDVAAANPRRAKAWPSSCDFFVITTAYQVSA